MNTAGLLIIQRHEDRGLEWNLKNSVITFNLTEEIDLFHAHA